MPKENMSKEDTIIKIISANIDDYVRSIDAPADYILNERALIDDILKNLRKFTSYEFFMNNKGSEEIKNNKLEKVYTTIDQIVKLDEKLKTTINMKDIENNTWDSTGIHYKNIFLLNHKGIVDRLKVIQKEIYPDKFTANEMSQAKRNHLNELDAIMDELSRSSIDINDLIKKTKDKLIIANKILKYGPLIESLKPRYEHYFEVLEQEEVKRAEMKKTYRQFIQGDENFQMEEIRALNDLNLMFYDLNDDYQFSNLTMIIEKHLRNENRIQRSEKIFSPKTLLEQTKNRCDSYKFANQLNSEDCQNLKLIANTHIEFGRRLIRRYGGITLLESKQKFGELTPKEEDALNYFNLGVKIESYLHVKIHQPNYTFQR